MSSFSLPVSRRAGFHPAARLAAVIAGVALEWQLHRARHAMGSLDDAALHDIGVDRGDIDAAVRHGRRALRG